MKLDFALLDCTSQRGTGLLAKWAFLQVRGTLMWFRSELCTYYSNEVKIQRTDNNSPKRQIRILIECHRFMARAEAPHQTVSCRLVAYVEVMRWGDRTPPPRRLLRVFALVFYRRYFPFFFKNLLRPPRNFFQDTLLLRGRSVSTY